jgi:hypothetical protein
MRLAGAGFPHQQNRLSLADVAAIGQFAHHRSRTIGTIEFELVERFHPRQPGFVQQPGLVQQPRNRATFALLRFGRQQASR